MAYTRVEMRKYMRAYRAERRRRIDEVLGKRCVKCGATDNLECDHIDRHGKVDQMANMITMSAEKFEAELKKCQRLCRSCHIRKSRECGDTVTAKPTTHGTTTMYNIPHRCRCDSCRAAMAAWRKQNRLARSLSGQSTRL